MTQIFTPALGEAFARLALSHVEQEYPNKLDHVLGGASDVAGPRALHPVFFGSFDWHSCVHGYWLLARTLRRFPNITAGLEISALFQRRFTHEAIAAETDYLARPLARGFERPYGWAWLLALQAELDQARDSALVEAAHALTPLSQAIAERFAAFLPLAVYPIRVGVHSNTAFAVRLGLDYADARDPALARLMRERIMRWYGNDRNCQAWEPSLDEFLSPALSVAEAMRRALPGDAFARWFMEFLPDAARGAPESLFTPAIVSDRTDGKIVHLDGLNLARAWCWRAIAAAPGLSGDVAARAHAAADVHLAASLGHVAGDYMGEHWLATFATLALDGL